MVIQKGADGLGGIVKSRICAVATHKGEYCGDDLIQAATPELVAQGALEHISNGALGVGVAVIQRDGMDLMGGQFGTAHVEADLWAVSMRDDDVPALLYHGCDMTHGITGGVILILDGLLVVILDEGIATHCDDSHAV